MAKNALDNEKQKLALLFQRKEEYENEARELLSGTLNVRDIEDARNAILMMEQYIALQEEQVALAQDRLEAARNKMTELMKERKTHETFREKAFEEFLMEENKQESKWKDERTSYK